MNKFKRQLKKFGMEKEFQNWLLSEPMKSRTLKVGDRIQVIKASEGDEVFYRTGDRGTVRRLALGGTHSLEIKFDVSSYNPQMWFVRPEQVKII